MHIEKRGRADGVRTCSCSRGSAPSYAYSVRAVLSDTGHVYFEVGCVILVTVTLGRYAEAVGKLKTTEALQGLRRLLPDRVRIIRARVEAVRTFRNRWSLAIGSGSSRAKPFRATAWCRATRRASTSSW